MPVAKRGPDSGASPRLALHIICWCPVPLFADPGRGTLCPRGAVFSQTRHLNTRSEGVPDRRFHSNCPGVRSLPALPGVHQPWRAAPSVDRRPPAAGARPAWMRADPALDVLSRRDRQIVRQFVTRAAGASRLVWWCRRSTVPTAISVREFFSHSNHRTDGYRFFLENRVRFCS